MVTSTKKSTRLSDSRNPILSCKTKWPLWCSECSSGGYEFTSVNFYFLPPSGNFNPLVGKASNSVTSKKSQEKMTLRSYPTQCPWHTDTLIILLYFMTVSMHMIINVTTSDLCFLVFSATTTLPGYYYYNDDGSNYYVYHWEWWTLNFDLVRLEL